MNEHKQQLQALVDYIEYSGWDLPVKEDCLYCHQDPMKRHADPCVFHAAKALLARPEPYQQPSVFEARVPPDSKWADFGEPAAAEKAREPRRLGWWVVFDEPDDTGRVPDGFFIDERRAVNFHMEPGWRRNHLEAVGLLVPSPPAATGETSTPISDEPDPEETSDDPPRAMDFIPPHLSGGCS